MKTSTNYQISSGRVFTNAVVSDGNNYASLRRWLRLGGGLAVSLGLSLLAATQALADSFTFTKIADTRSDFLNISNAPAINDSGTVAFIATPKDTVQAVYTSNGSEITEIVNTSALASLYNVESVSLSSFALTLPLNAPSVSPSSFISINAQGTVAFPAATLPNGIRIVTRSLDGSLTTRANIPEILSQQILGLSLNSQDDLVYSFYEFNSPVSTYLVRNNASIAFVNDSSPIRSEKRFRSIGNFALNNSGIVNFVATRLPEDGSSGSGTRAIFSSDASSLTTVLETDATYFNANDHEDFVLLNQDSIQLFNSTSGKLTTIADTSGPYRQFATPAINNNGKVAFKAILNLGETGIFTGPDPIADKVIATGDSLDGSSVKNVSFMPSGLNNNGQITFFATLADGTTGIFRAEPTSGTPKQPEPVAQPKDVFHLSKIVNTLTSIPDGVGNFTNLFGAAIEGNNVVFGGAGSDGQKGIYNSNDGILSTIANQNTAVPGGTGTFSSFSGPVIDSGDVVFAGISSPEKQGGIYIQRGKTLEVVEDNNTPIPGGIGNFNNFTFMPRVALYQGNVAFEGVDNNLHYGIYISRDGTLQVVADRNTPIPGSTKNFNDFGNPALNGNNIVFSANDLLRTGGVYESSEGVLQVVADKNTAVPNGIGNFTYFSYPVISGNNVAFLGSDANDRDGIYIRRDGLLQVVVDSNTTIPGSNKKFERFGNPVIDGDFVAFLGGVNIPDGFNFSDPYYLPLGIYAYVGDCLLKVVDFNSRLEGKKLSSLNLGSDALSGRSLTFTASFTDGTQAIYRADLISGKLSK